MKIYLTVHDISNFKAITEKSSGRLVDTMITRARFDVYIKNASLRHKFSNKIEHRDAVIYITQNLEITKYIPTTVVCKELAQAKGFVFSIESTSIQ